MKRFTVIFSILLVLCFGGTLAYVAATPDSCRRPPPCLPGKMRTRTPRSGTKRWTAFLRIWSRRG